MLRIENVTAMPPTAACCKVLTNVSIDIHAGAHRGRGRRVRQWQEHPAARVVTGLLPPMASEVFYGGRAPAPALQAPHQGPAAPVQMIYQMPDTALNPRQRVR